MADEAAAARTGSLVDERYQLAELIASGSMGAVYKAERVPVGKVVAVKFLHASFANDPEFQARFERETRVMSKLAHPNCVSVLDFGVWQGEPYLVMDFVAGTTLRARIDEGPLPPQVALAFARQVAAGLAHAHEQGIIHRDIKPANIMITDEIGAGERVRLLDFGLARLRGNVGRDATQTNMVVGTPNYMAPEQTVPGASIEARTDIYAVGVVLFEMVVGDRPFHAEDTLQLLGMHRAAPIPRLADRIKDGVALPAGLQEVIDKAMAKSPDQRYRNAIELAAAIDDVIAGKVVVEAKPRAVNSGGPTAVAPTMLDISSSALEDEPPPRSRFWRTMISAMVVVGGAAAMAGYLVHRNTVRGAATTQPAGSGGGVVAGDAMVGSAAIVVTASDADVVAIAATDSHDAAELDAAPSGPPPIDAEVDDAGLPILRGSGDEIEMDPAKAEDLDPAANGSAAKPDDEADNAPATAEQVEALAAKTPPLATTLPATLQLIKDGNRELALASLRALRKRSPKSAYIPFLLGNLYYDQRWWSVSMDDYQDAIRKNAAYRTNPTLNRNVIRMLASTKTRQKASNFLRSVIGRPAAPYLKYAAEHEDNPVVRKQAGSLRRYLR